MSTLKGITRRVPLRQALFKRRGRKGPSKVARVTSVRGGFGSGSSTSGHKELFISLEKRKRKSRLLKLFQKIFTI